MLPWESEAWVGKLERKKIQWFGRTFSKLQLARLGALVRKREKKSFWVWMKGLEASIMRWGTDALNTCPQSMCHHFACSRLLHVFGWQLCLQIGMSLAAICHSHCSCTPEPSLWYQRSKRWSLLSSMYAIPTLCGTQDFVEAHTRGENRMEIKYAANAEGFRTIWTLLQGGNNSGTEIE